MTETQEKEDLRDYYLVNYSIGREGSDNRQAKMKIVLEFNKAESITKVLEGFREEERANIKIEDPVPLDMKKVLTKIKINKMYSRDWFYIIRVLDRYGYVKKLPKRKKGEVGKYFLLKPLPTQEELGAMLIESYTRQAQDVFEEACDEIESLKEEIGDWKDNIEENFSGSEKYSQLEEAYDQLDNFSKPDWPDELEDKDIKVVYIESPPKIFRGRITNSRSSRLGEACAKLEAVTDALENFKTEFLDELRALHEQLEEKKEEIEEKATRVEELRKEAQEIRDEYEEYETDLEDFKENPEEYDEEPAEPDSSLDDATERDTEADDLETAKDEMEQNLTDWCEQNNVDPDTHPDDIESAIDSFIEDINSGKEEIEGVEFPGMYG